MKDFQDAILKSLKEADQSIPIRDMLKELHVRRSEKKYFFSALDDLERDKKILVSKKKRIHLPQKNGTVEATVISLSRGFAFARPEDGGQDIFIHGDKLKNAFIGDRVQLFHMEEGPKGISAEVSKIVEKGKRLVTGTVKKFGPYLMMDPDIAIRYSIPISKKSVTRVKEGDKIQANIRQLPYPMDLEADVVKVYGKAGSARICTYAILDQNGIKTDFSPEALAEAEKAASRPITEADRKGRLDLRDLPICTIDGADSKDLDDAISVERIPEGFRLGVHIADVSHYVAEGGPLDMEALSRGTSVYFADRVVPMLPKALSNGACSLNAGEDKLAFSAIVDLDSSGQILSYQFRKSVICSKVRGVYSEVNSLFDGTAGEEIRKKYAPVLDSLRLSRELAGILKIQFKKAGVVDLESTESVFTIDSNGVCVDVQPRKSGEAEQMIEYLMITANQAAAKLAKKENLPFVYRIHEPPAPDRVQTLIQLVDAVGLNSKPLKGKEIKPADFADILSQAEKTPAKKVISHQLLRTMMKARYDVKPVGHFGLALADYCHFTSPIRRYPDTAIHRILSAALPGGDKKKLYDHYAPFAAEAAKMSSDAEVRAMTAERSAEDCYMAEYMTQHIGEVYDGVISGVTQHGVFVELENTVEGFVPMETFPDAEEYQFDGVLSQRNTHTGTRLTIGDPLRVRVASSDVASGRIDFFYVAGDKN